MGNEPKNPYPATIIDEARLAFLKAKSVARKAMAEAIAK